MIDVKSEVDSELSLSLSDNAMALSDEGGANKEQKISQTVNATDELALFAYDRCCNGSGRSRRIHR